VIAAKDVAAATTKEMVGADGAHERVIVFRARGVLDAFERVAFGVAAESTARLQVDSDRVGRGLIRRHVDTRTAVQAVGAGPAVESVVTVVAFEDVIAAHAEEHVGLRVSGEGVVAVAADGILDHRRAVDREGAAGEGTRLAGFQVDVDGGGHRRSADRFDPRIGVGEGDRAAHAMGCRRGPELVGEDVDVVGSRQAAVGGERNVGDDRLEKVDVVVLGAERPGTL